MNKAITYIESFIKELVPSANVAMSQPDHFHWNTLIKIQDKEMFIVFDKARIDDLESAISKYDGSAYKDSITSDTDFKIIIELGKQGFINDFDIVSALLEEKRDWFEGRQITITSETFSRNFTKEIYEGLVKLQNYLQLLLQQYGEENEDIKKDFEDVNRILDHFNQKKSFSSTGVSVRSLSILKAAVICEIIEKVKQKDKNGVPRRVMNKITQDIYLIVDALRKFEFLNIESPDCVKEYREAELPRKKDKIDILEHASEPNVFISYSTKDKIVAGKIKSIFDAYKIPAFLAHEDIDITEEWKKRIVLELSRANVFIAILSDNYKNSDWASQESGVACFRRILIIPLFLDEAIMPFGFLNDWQGKKITPDYIPIEYIIKPVVDKFPDRLIDKLIDKLEAVNNFRSAEDYLGLLSPHYGMLSQEQVDKLMGIAIKNGQIWDAQKCREQYLPELLKICENKISKEQHEILSFQIEKGEWFGTKSKSTDKARWIEFERPWLK